MKRLLPLLLLTGCTDPMFNWQPTYWYEPTYSTHGKQFASLPDCVAEGQCQPDKEKPIDPIGHWKDLHGAVMLGTRNVPDPPIVLINTLGVPREQ